MGERAEMSDYFYSLEMLIGRAVGSEEASAFWTHGAWLCNEENQ